MSIISSITDGLLIILKTLLFYGVNNRVVLTGRVSTEPVKEIVDYVYMHQMRLLSLFWGYF
uniref:Uncharacterized protein n=1 Tax=Bartonella schoenbuchensis (strain DSM 13525 / NCTC 13165 / R1) TaxID=687861 RepID=E6YXY4_BARSR|nr:hypothetical protein B11C_10196 [Bartonella schoenbuchensis R1]